MDIINRYLDYLEDSFLVNKAMRYNVKGRKYIGGGSMVRKQLEVDFVANKGSRRYYIQSAYRLASMEKIAQERSSLVNIDDSFKKIIVQFEPMEPWYDDDGILRLGIMDFLLNPDSLDM